MWEKDACNPSLQQLKTPSYKHLLSSWQKQCKKPTIVSCSDHCYKPAGVPYLPSHLTITIGRGNLLPSKVHSYFQNLSLASKISKPRFGHLFLDLLQGCVKKRLRIPWLLHKPLHLKESRKILILDSSAVMLLAIWVDYKQFLRKEDRQQQEQPWAFVYCCWTRYRLLHYSGDCLATASAGH